MRAKNVLLTHFSTRYPHMPAYVGSPQASLGGDEDDETNAPQNGPPIVALALDHAHIRVGDMWKMQMYLRAIEQSFLDTREEGDEEEEKQVLLASAGQVE